MLHVAMESAEVDGLLDEVELAAWEWVDELMVDDRWEEVEDGVSARVEEKNLPALNSLDAASFAQWYSMRRVSWGGDVWLMKPPPTV